MSVRTHLTRVPKGDEGKGLLGGHTESVKTVSLCLYSSTEAQEKGLGFEVSVNKYPREPTDSLRSDPERHLGVPSTVTSYLT